MLKSNIQPSKESESVNWFPERDNAIDAFPNNKNINKTFIWMKPASKIIFRKHNILNNISVREIKQLIKVKRDKLKLLKQRQL